MYWMSKCVCLTLTPRTHSGVCVSETLCACQGHRGTGLTSLGTGWK